MLYTGLHPPQCHLSYEITSKMPLQEKRVIQTLEHNLHSDCPPGVETLSFFVILTGRIDPQPSQHRGSFFVPDTSCRRKFNQARMIINIMTYIYPNHTTDQGKRKAGMDDSPPSILHPGEKERKNDKRKRNLS